MAGLPVVTDASFSLSIFLNHPFQKASLMVADTLKRKGMQMVAPSLWAYETTSSICKAVHFQMVTEDDAREIIALLEIMGVQLIPPDEGYNKRAFDLTLRLKRAAAYDSYYLALAESLKCDLWTADKRLYQVAQDNGMAWVRHVREAMSLGLID
jgi:predicted nucleic acid-binding protein